MKTLCTNHNESNFSVLSKAHSGSRLGNSCSVHSGALFTRLVGIYHRCVFARTRWRSVLAPCTFYPSPFRLFFADHEHTGFWYTVLVRIILSRFIEFPPPPVPSNVVRCGAWERPHVRFRSHRSSYLSACLLMKSCSYCWCRCFGGARLAADLRRKTTSRWSICYWW